MNKKISMHIGGVRYYQIFRLLARYMNIYSYLKFSNYEGDYPVTILAKLQLQWNHLGHKDVGRYNERPSSCTRFRGSFSYVLLFLG